MVGAIQKLKKPINSLLFHLCIFFFGMILSLSSYADFAKIKYPDNHYKNKIEGLEWSQKYFDVVLQNSSDGKTNQFALLRGEFYHPNWVLMPVDSNRIITKTSGNSKVFVIAVPFDQLSSHVKLQAVSPYGETQTEEFDLISSPGLSNFFQKRLRLQTPVGTFKEKSSTSNTDGDTTTQLGLNIAQFGGDILFYRAESDIDPALEFMLSLDGGYMMASSDLTFPFLWAGKFQTAYRNAFEIGSLQVSPFIHIQGESYSILSNQVVKATYSATPYLSYQARTLNLYWLGVGMRIGSACKESGWEISPSLSRTIPSSNFLSSSSVLTSGDSFAQLGWKASLQSYFQLGNSVENGGRTFIGIDSSYVNLRGDITITGIEGSAVLGYRF